MTGGRVVHRHEDVGHPGTLPELAAAFAGRARSGAGRGEITVVVEGSREEPQPELDAGAVDDAIRLGLARGLDKRSVAREVAARSGRPAREIYARAVELEKG